MRWFYSNSGGYRPTSGFSVQIELTLTELRVFLLIMKSTILVLGFYTRLYFSIMVILLLIMFDRISGYKYKLIMYVHFLLLYTESLLNIKFSDPSKSNGMDFYCIVFWVKF